MRQLTPAASALTLVFCGSQATAEPLALEEVIVTAQKRSESLQDVPVAVNAFSSETILEAGINNTEDLAILTPSLNSNANTSPFTTRLQIRGIGTTQTDPALEPSVGLFVDGIYMGRTGLGTSDLTDIERIEVLQGPQGTLYGKNTNAGAISVITKGPNLEEFEGYLEASVGNYGMGRLTATASAPLADTAAYRISGNIHQRDGYYDNASGDDLNDADDWNLQGKLLWAPNDAFNILLSAARVERDTTCCGADSTQGEPVQEELAKQSFSQDKNDPYDYEIAVDVDSAFEMESDLVSLHIDYFADWGTLSSLTAWNDYEYTTSIDADRSELGLLSVENEFNSGDSLSQEFRLDAEIGNNLEYQIGLFYYEQTTQRGDTSPSTFIGNDFITIGDQQGLPLPVPTLALIAQPGDFLFYQNIWDTETLALFGQATWHVGERWHFTGGLRWTDEEKEAELFSQSSSTAPLAPTVVFLNLVSTPIDTTLDRQTDNVDWLLKAVYDISESSMLYVSAATGTKSGGFNGVTGEPELREFDDEFTTSYELGIKSTLLDSRMRLNATAFYTEIEDYQIQQQLPAGIGTFVSNEAEIEVSGIDIQMDALPLPNLTLTAGLLYMHDYDITAGLNEGASLPFTADYSANIGATLVFPLADGGLFIRGDYIYMDDHSTNSGVELVDKDFDDRNLLNARIGWRNDHWNLSLWGKNLTDDEYASQTLVTQLFSGQDSYFLAPPRTYGATVRYDF
ncbi:MAG: TonB-dependent receptor [Pseudomonadota bacterium]